MIRRLFTTVIFAALLVACSSTKQRSGYVTEQEARLISLARDAATARGFSLKDAIYEVRPDGDGWVVQVDKAPGYHGSGELLFVVDATFFVKFNAEGAVTEILTSAPRPPTAPVTRSSDSRPTAAAIQGSQNQGDQLSFRGRSLLHPN